MLKGDGGGTSSLWVVLTWEFEVQATLKVGGGAQTVSIGGGGMNKNPCLECIGGGGGAQTVSDPRFSNFVAPLPVINDHSL